MIYCSFRAFACSYNFIYYHRLPSTFAFQGLAGFSLILRLLATYRRRTWKDDISPVCISSSRQEEISRQKCPSPAFQRHVISCRWHCVMPIPGRLLQISDTLSIPGPEFPQGRYVTGARPAVFTRFRKWQIPHSAEFRYSTHAARQSSQIARYMMITSHIYFMSESLLFSWARATAFLPSRKFHLKSKLFFAPDRASRLI